MDAWSTGATVSGFGDEIHPDLDVQFDVLSDLDIDRLDLRGVAGKSVLEFDEALIEEIESGLARHDIMVASVGSPIGKVDIGGGQLQTATRDGAGDAVADVETQLAQLDAVLELADRVDATGVRIFSYYLPDDDAAADHRETVIDRLERMTDRAADADIPLLHENMPGTYGATPKRVRDLLTTIDSPYFRAIYEPANFYAAGAKVYPDALLTIVEYVDCVHVKDARGAGDWETDDVDLVPVGEGDLDWPGILRALHRRGFDGTFALEPHLAVTESGGGLSGPDGFRRAAEAFLSAFRATESGTS